MQEEKFIKAEFVQETALTRETEHTRVATKRVEGFFAIIKRTRYNNINTMEEPQPQRKEIYTYKAPWTVFSLAWSNRYVFVWCMHMICFSSCLCSHHVSFSSFNHQPSTTLQQNNTELIKTHNLD